VPVVFAAWIGDQYQLSIAQPKANLSIILISPHA